jgi:hypothetical protein
MRPVTVFVTVFVAVFIAGCAGADRAADPRIREAERLAAHGELEAARAQLQTIHDELRDSGAETSAALHYNLGTLALGVDAIGEAVLHLGAAARRDPLDDDIRHNLDTALARRADQVSAGVAHAPGARLPPGPVRLGFGIAIALLGVVIALWGAGRGRVADAARRLWPVFAGAVVVCAVLLGLRWRADATAVAVVMGETEARPQPDASATGFGVHAGLTGVVIAEQQGFLRLRLENDVDVWVAHDAVQLVP